MLFCITPERTVAICGRWSGFTIVATMLPPKAGRRRNTRTEVATDNGSTHQCNLRLLLLEEVDENVCMRS
ncbi:Uncharacterised protein [Segatella copri]|nr:Uncharacterised protein [Segatella copri]